MNCFRTDGKRQERWLLPFSKKLHHATLCEVRQKKELAAWKIVLVAQWNEMWYTGKTRKGECFMRKLTALLLALITSLSLAACSFVALPMDPEQPTNQKQEQLAEDGTYTTKEDVARYIHLYGHLPDNFITKKRPSSWAGPVALWSRMHRAAASAAAGSETMRACCRRQTAGPGPSVTSTPWVPSPGDRSGSSFPTMG